MTSGPFRSRKVLDHARGQRCTLRFPFICNGNPETVVSCHIRDDHKGMGIKASDSSIAFGCSSCHRYLDEEFPKVSPDSSEHRLGLMQIIRGLQRTLEILIADEVIGFPHDPPPKPKATKPRKPKAQRQAIKSPPFPKGPKREIPSRQFQSRRKSP